MIKKAFIATTLTLAAASAQAELIEYDWEAQGDSAVTLDTETGNIWLDIDITGSMSIEQVKSSIQDDVRFTGWRMPTVDEIETLSANIFGTIPGTNYIDGNITPSGLSSDTITEMKANHALFGYAHNINYVYGLYEKDGGTKMFGSGVGGVFLNYTASDTLSFLSPYFGVYLVSTDYNTAYDSVSINERMGTTPGDVPAPFMAFAGLGLLALGLRRKKH